MTRSKVKSVFKRLGAILFWIALWQLVAMIVGLELLVPTPLRTLQTLFEMGGTAKFWQAVAASLLRIAMGFACALVLGTLFAALAMWQPWFRTLFAPMLHLIRSVPVASFIILALVWIKTDYLPVFISFLMVFPMVWANVEAGLSSVDKKLLELCRVMQVSHWETLTGVYLPALRPSLRAACLTGIGFAWKAGVAAEVICKPRQALGTLLANGKAAVETVEVFAVTLVIVVLSLLLDSFLKWIWRRRDGQI
jgi:NitT/TauT family transport system permease protein